MIKVYVANLAKYNEGTLKGEWIELPQHWDDIQETLDLILGIGDNGERVDEEYAIHAYESDIEGLTIGEYDSLEELNELAEELENLPEWDLEVLSAILEHLGDDLAEALEVLRDGEYSYYPGVYEEEDLGVFVVDEGLFGEVPESLLNYLDYEAIGRDWRINEGGSFTSKGYITVQ